MNKKVHVELLTLFVGSIFLGLYLESWCAGLACLLLGFTFYQPRLI